MEPLAFTVVPPELSFLVTTTVLYRGGLWPDRYCRLSVDLADRLWLPSAALSRPQDFEEFERHMRKYHAT